MDECAFMAVCISCISPPLPFSINALYEELGVVGVSSYIDHTYVLVFEDLGVDQAVHVSEMTTYMGVLPIHITPYTTCTHHTTCSSSGSNNRGGCGCCC